MCFGKQCLTLMSTVTERRPSAVCSRVGVGSSLHSVWSLLSHSLVYFHHRMAILDFYQGNRFSQRRFRMGHSSKKGIFTQLLNGSTLPLPRLPDGQRPERMAFLSKQGSFLIGNSLSLLLTFLATGFILFSA